MLVRLYQPTLALLQVMKMFFLKGIQALLASTMCLGFDEISANLNCSIFNATDSKRFLE
jgi:hypothetical protein